MAAGRIANIPGSLFYIFGSLEDRILLDLASTEGATEEEKLDYKQRLHSEIVHLTQNGIQDFETVAAKIVEFRRNYLADQTRIIRNI